MSTYNDASLIYYPSGYKAGTAYSLKPTDGSGDLTFTRASTATRVNESGLIEEVAANVPRLDNSQGGCSTLLLEPQRTNLALRSEEFDSASWAKVNSLVTANTTISPDGTLTADSIINNVGNNQFARIRQIPSVIIGQTYVYSCFFKRGSTNYGIIALFDGANFSAFFDLNNGTIENVSSGITTTIENFQDEWYKCSIIRTVATSSVQFLLSMSTNSSLNTSNLNDFVYIWGADLQLGSFPTSYIPTTTTAVTRVGDNASKSGISSLIGQTEGTLFVETSISNISPIFRRPILRISDGTNSNYIHIVITNSNLLGVVKYYLGAFSNVNMGKSAAQLLGNHKIAITYKLDEYKLYFDGVYVNTYTGMGSMPSTNSVSLEQDYNNRLQSFMLFPYILSDAELIALTTL